MPDQQRTGLDALRDFMDSRREPSQAAQNEAFSTQLLALVGSYSTTFLQDIGMPVPDGADPAVFISDNQTQITDRFVEQNAQRLQHYGLETFVGQTFWEGDRATTITPEGLHAASAYFGPRGLSELLSAEENPRQSEKNMNKLSEILHQFSGPANGRSAEAGRQALYEAADDLVLQMDVQEQARQREQAPQENTLRATPEQVRDMLYRVSPALYLISSGTQDGQKLALEVAKDIRAHRDILHYPLGAHYYNQDGVKNVDAIDAYKSDEALARDLMDPNKGRAFVQGLGMGLADFDRYADPISTKTFGAGVEAMIVEKPVLATPAIAEKRERESWMQEQEQQLREQDALKQQALVAQLGERYSEGFNGGAVTDSRTRTNGARSV